MKWGVFSDVHSNMDALERVLAELRRRGAQGWVCCGDIVGYGPQPNEVCETIAALKPLHAVSGNHDLGVLGRMDIEWFNPFAQAAAIWTRWKLSAMAADFLEALPARVETAAFMVAHGSPRDPSEEYLLTPQQFMDNLRHLKVSPCFVGHSHVTVSFRQDPSAGPLGVQGSVLSPGQKVRAEAGVPWVLNPGSVGQPRDHDPRASGGIYDDESREFELVRVEYDIPGVQRKMLEVGLPEFLALRLAVGQ